MKFPAFAFEMKIVEVIATPNAPPICWLVFRRPDASPACRGGTPMNPAIVTGMNPNVGASPNVEVERQEIGPEVAVHRQARIADQGQSEHREPRGHDVPGAAP